MKFCFVHAADLHLDTPFSGIGKVAPWVAEALRNASLDAFDRLVDLAIERDAAFVVFAGDIYDGADRGVRAQLRFRRGLESLSDHGISSFVVHGNHDPLEAGWSAVREWPELATVFGHEEVGEATVERQGETIATVHGISYAQREQTENLALRFRRGAGAGIHVGVLHANAGNNPEHDPYAPCTLEDLARANLDYWALGHIHQRQILSHGDPWIVYSGNLQGRSPKPSEMGPKGAYVVEVEGAAIAEPEFVALDSVRFEEMELEVGDEDIPALESELFELGEARLATSDTRSLLIRCILKGAGDLHRDLARQSALEGLLKDMHQETVQREPFLWWESLVDKTIPGIDMQAIRDRGDFSAELIGLADGLTASGEQKAALVDSLLAGLPILKLQRLGVDVPDLDETELWDDAVTLAVEMLEGGDV